MALEMLFVLVPKFKNYAYKNEKKNNTTYLILN